jgi:hypothetical protein
LINQNLHRQPAALDSALHRQLKLQVPITDWSLANQLNAIFLAVAEFGDACKEFPIVFVKAGKEADGTDAIAPIAVLGMVANDNLYPARRPVARAVHAGDPAPVPLLHRPHGRTALCHLPGHGLCRRQPRPKASRSSWMTGSRPNC